MFTGIIFYFVPQRKQWRGDKLGGADHWISLLLEITCSETSSCATFADAPPVCAFARRVATALYGNQYHNNETVVYRAALTFQCGSGGETVLSTLHRLQGNKIRWPESTKFHATQACVCVLVTWKRVDGWSRVNFLWPKVVTACVAITRQDSGFRFS